MSRSSAASRRHQICSRIWAKSVGVAAEPACRGRASSRGGGANTPVPRSRRPWPQRRPGRSASHRVGETWSSTPAPAPVLSATWTSKSPATRFATARAVDTAAVEPSDGEAVFRIDSFALTANNVTYGAVGDLVGYWNFYPASEDGWGRIPVWGFADVAASRAEGVDVGDRYFGFWPMSTEAVRAAGLHRSDRVHRRHAAPGGTPVDLQPLLEDAGGCRRARRGADVAPATAVRDVVPHRRLAGRRGHLRRRIRGDLQRVEQDRARVGLSAQVERPGDRDRADVAVQRRLRRGHRRVRPDRALRRPAARARRGHRGLRRLRRQCRRARRSPSPLRRAPPAQRHGRH